MMFCQCHKDKLEKIAREEGLGQFVPDTKEQARTMLNELLEQPENYWPFLSIIQNICFSALLNGGLYLLGNKPDGAEYCPVCEALENGGTEEQWLHEPVLMEKVEATKRGLIGTVN